MYKIITHDYYLELSLMDFSQFLRDRPFATVGHVTDNF